MNEFGRRPSQARAAHAPRPHRDDGDNRFAPRRASQTPAVITFDGAMESIPCLIRDMSTTGARLEVQRSAGNPFMSKWKAIERVWLILRSDRVMYDCKVTRRSEAEVGVKFMAAPKAITRFSR